MIEYFSSFDLRIIDESLDNVNIDKVSFYFFALLALCRGIGIDQVKTFTNHIFVQFCILKISHRFLI